MPAAHGEHVGLKVPVAEYVPGKQLCPCADVQLAAPEFEVNPDAQGVQVLAPGAE